MNIEKQKSLTFRIEQNAKIWVNVWLQSFAKCILHRSSKIPKYPRKVKMERLILMSFQLCSSEYAKIKVSRQVTFVEGY